MSVHALKTARVANLKAKVSPEEWQARVDLAACYRLMDLYGMTDLIANHISMRVPGEPDHFLINAYGLLYDEITASSLLKIDHDGNVLAKPEFGAGLDYGVNRAGFVIHSWPTPRPRCASPTSATTTTTASRPTPTCASRWSGT